MKKGLYTDKISLVSDCTRMTLRQFDFLMEGAVKANGSKIRRMIKQQIPDLYESLALEFYNPYESNSQRTPTHYVYVHSGIEYFLLRS